MAKISGEFKIQMEPQKPSFLGLDETKTGRMSFRKAYTGPLEAVGIGEMLSVQCAKPGHAGYVAIEQIKGTLNGLSGSFVVQHFGLKNETDNELRIDIIPGSGVEQLQGLTGTLIIRMEGKIHHYELNYEIPTHTP